MRCCSIFQTDVIVSMKFYIIVSSPRLRNFRGRRSPKALKAVASAPGGHRWTRPKHERSVPGNRKPGTPTEQSERLWRSFHAVWHTIAVWMLRFFERDVFFGGRAW